MVHDSTFRSRLLEWAQTTLLAANLAWTTLCLGGYLAQTLVVTSALTAALLFVHSLGAMERVTSASGAGPRRFHPAGWLFLPFLAYAAVNVLCVTPVRWLGWFDWFGWMQMIAIFWAVLNGIRSRDAQRAVWITLFGIAVVGVLFGCYQRFVQPDWLILHRVQAAQYLGRASGPFGIPNSFAGLLILLLPTAGALAFRRHASATERVFFAWLALVLLFGLGLTISRGGWLALAVALTAWPLLAGVTRAVGARPPPAALNSGGRAAGSHTAGLRWRSRVLASVAVFLAVVLVAGVTYATSSAVRERFVQFVHDTGERSRPILWRVAWHLVREHPLLGSGAGSFDPLFERFRPEGFLNRPYWAHNDYLNTLSDYGVIGFVLLFGAVAIVIWRCGRNGAVECRRHDALADPLVREAQAIGLLAFGLQLFVEFHFEIPALAMTFATVAALMVQRAWPLAAAARTSALEVGCSTLEAREARPRFVLPTLLAIAAVAIGVFVIREYRGEALRQAARDRLDTLIDIPVTEPRYRQRIAATRADLARAVALAPENAQAWADRAYAAAQWARLFPAQQERLGAEAEEDANRALKLAPICAEYWIRRGVGRDLQGRWDEAGADFTQAIQLDPKMPLPWFHYAYHLALRPPAHAMAEAMVGICLRLDPKNPEALRLRQHLATGRSGP